MSEPSLPARIAGYRVLSRLGSGGMGEVFLAEDLRLKRHVAIKRLLPAAMADPHASRRLMAEARAAARLDHPNICGIYEVGEDDGALFIVMPVVEGETLAARLGRGPLPIADALSIAAQVADALAAAHAEGILHRDIKPANLMINTRAHVRVMDFGLATFTEASEDLTTPETVSRLTATGTMMGTPGYMSPEQVRAERLDARGDLFSLGVVLYEMVAGCRPFDRRTLADGLSAVLTDEAPPLARMRPEAPEELQRIVGKALRKSKEQRYQSAIDLQVDVRMLLQTLQAGSAAAASGAGTAESSAATVVSRAVGTGPDVGRPAHRRVTPVAIVGGLVVLAIAAIAWFAGTRSGPGGFFSRVTGGAVTGTDRAGESPGAGIAIGSLAVLPLANNSGAPDTEYVADGITESLIRSLMELPNLKVISRNTVFRFKGKTADAQKIGSQLGVGAVMTGTISLADGQLVIDVELSSVRDASVILSHRYVQQASTGVLTLESDIAQDVARNLRVKLTGDNQRQLARLPTKSPEAYQLYLKGRFYENRDTPDALHQALTYYQQATERDPEYAQAYAGMAQTYLELGNFFEAPKQVMPRARDYANKALQLDPDLVDARIALGLVSLAYDWDWNAAAKALTNSSGMIPEAVEMFSCSAHLLESTGHGPEAEQQLRTALVSDPLSVPLNVELGCGSYYRRRYDAAVQENRDALELDPGNIVAYWGLGRAYGQKKMYKGALDELNKVEAKLGEAPSLIIAEIGYVQAASGHPAEARAILRKLDVLSAKEFVDPYLVAAIHMGLGDTPRTFEWLEKAFDAKSGFLVALSSEPKWDGVRSDPRFQSLMKRVGF